MIKINPNNQGHYIGSKYKETEHLDIKDIAKLIRKKIKEQVKIGSFPQGKYSVRINRFRGGESLDVNITLPNAKELRKSEKNLIKSIERIVEQYNFYAGDAMVDYWYGGFFNNVDIWCE